MTRTLTLLVTALVLCLGVIGTQFEHNGAAVYAQNTPVPGYKYMLSGYDMREMKSKIKNDEKHVSNLLFQPTYQFGYTYRIPNVSKVYKQPDQVTLYDYVTTNEEKTSDIHVHLKESLHYAANGFSFKIGASIGKIGIQAKDKTLWGHLHFLYNKTTIMSAQGRIHGTLFQSSLEPPQFFKFNPFFKKALDAIPSNPTSKSDLSKVQTLTSYFGSMFPKKLYFGGNFQTITQVDRDILKQKNKTWLYNQLSLKFTYEAFNFDPSGFINRTNINISNDFKNHSDTTVFFQGGVRSLQNITTLDKWFRSITQQPAVVGGDFEPLSELVFNNAKKKKNLHDILKTYVNTGKIKPAQSSEKVHMNDGQAYNKIQGYEFVGTGMDSMSLEPKLNLFKQPFAPSNTQIWTNPIYSNIKWAVPHSCQVINNPESYYSNSSYISISKSDYEYKYKNHYSSSSFLGLGHHSYDVFIYNKRFEFDDEYQFNKFRRESWYDLQLNPLYEITPEKYLDPYVKEAIDNLPTRKDVRAGIVSSKQLKEDYKSFFRYFGTSYVKRVTMGGGIFYKVRFKKDLTKYLSIHKIHEESSWSFFGLFGGHSHHDKYLKNLSEKFKKHSTIEFRTEGGMWKPDATRTTGGLHIDEEHSPKGSMSWDDFKDSIKHHLYPLHYEIKPIYSIVSDHEKKNIMRNILQEYLKEQNQKKYPFEQ